PFYCDLPRPPRSTPFPYTTLFRSVPVESDEFRCTPEGRLRVYRTRNAGGSWESLERGLPQQGAYETVLRDGFTTDSLDPAGLFFGTRSGKLYASKDEGKGWKKILE